MKWRISLIVLIAFASNPRAHAAGPLEFCTHLFRSAAAYFDDAWEFYQWAKPLKASSPLFWERMNSGLFHRVKYRPDSAFAQLEKTIAEFASQSKSGISRTVTDSQTLSQIEFRLDLDPATQKFQIYLPYFTIAGVEMAKSSSKISFEYARLCSALVKGLDQLMQSRPGIRQLEIRAGSVANPVLVDMFKRSGFRKRDPLNPAYTLKGPLPDWSLLWDVPAKY